MNWSLTHMDGVPVFTLRGYLSGSDSQRLLGATSWVSVRTELVVLDVRELQGCNARGEHELAACVQLLAPNVVLCLGDPDHLHLSEDGLLALPRAHLLSNAVTAVALLRRRNAHGDGPASWEPILAAAEPTARPGSSRRAPLERVRTVTQTELGIPLSIPLRAGAISRGWSEHA
jgi:hypothetical protein